MSTIIHDELVNQAAGWLRKQGCSVVITDMSHGGSETPDAIGWKGTGSILIECKASLSDFHTDKHKSFRRNSEMGMGGQRWFLTMRGLVNPECLPPQWGLMEFDGRKIRVVVKPEGQATVWGKSQEISLLISALRRLASTAPPKGLSVRFYTMEGTSNPRATLGVTPSPAL